LPGTPADAAIGAREKLGISSHSAGNWHVVLHGGGPRSERKDIARWFRAVDHAICARLRIGSWTPAASTAPTGHAAR
jgi:hypothetical protein